MTDQRTLLQDFQFDNPLYAHAIVTVYGVTLGGAIDLANVITLYADQTGEEFLANPQDLTSRGKWRVPVYILEPCIIRVIGPHVASHDTGVVRPRLDTDSVEEAEAAAFRAGGFASMSDRNARKAKQSAADAASAAAAFDPLNVAVFL